MRTITTTPDAIQMGKGTSWVAKIVISPCDRHLGNACPQCPERRTSNLLAEQNVSGPTRVHISRVSSNQKSESSGMERVSASQKAILELRRPSSAQSYEPPTHPESLFRGSSLALQANSSLSTVREGSDSGARPKVEMSRAPSTSEVRSTRYRRLSIR